MLVTGLLAWQQIRWYVIPLNLLTAVFSFFGLIILHEWGHAAAAWALGGEVHTISVGLGRIVWQKRLRTLLLVLRINPDGGYSVSTFPTKQKLRLRLVVLYTGGLLVSLLLIVLLVPTFNLYRLWNAWAWREIIVLLSGLFLLINLSVTQSYRPSDFSYVKSDGALIRDTLSQAWQPDQAFIYIQSVKAFYLICNGQASQAISLLRSALNTTPEHPGLQNVLGYALLEDGQLAAAKAWIETTVPPDDRIDLANCYTIWQDFLPTVADRYQMVAFNLNNLAYALVLTDTDGSQLERAQRCVAEALSLMPWMPSIRSTQATIWLMQGRTEEAIQQYREVLQQGSLDFRSQAVTQLWLARAYAQRGDLERSKQLLKLAIRELGADYFLLANDRSLRGMLSESQL